MKFTVEEVSNYLNGCVEKNMCLQEVLTQINEHSIVESNGNFIDREYNLNIPKYAYVITIEDYFEGSTISLEYYDDFHWVKNGKMSYEQVFESYEPNGATHIACLPESK